MKCSKAFGSICFVTFLMCMTGVLQVFASSVYNFDFNNNTVPTNWTIGYADVVNKQLEINYGAATTWTVYDSPEPYLDGQVIVEFDVSSTSDKFNLNVQNPDVGNVSLLRLQQTGTDGKTLQLQASKDDATGNANYTITSNFIQGQLYHIKLLLDFDTSDVKTRTTVSCYLYNSAGELLGSAENRIYFDASTRANPTRFRRMQMQNNGTYGKVIFDNLSIYQNTNESSVDATLCMLKVNDGETVKSNVILQSQGLNSASISWESLNQNVITNDGTYTMPNIATVVTLRATISKGDVTKTKDIAVVVPSKIEMISKGVVNDASNVSVALNLENRTLEEQNVILVLATYDGNMLVDIDYRNISFDEQEIISEIILFANKDKESNTYRIFLWDSPMSPLY